MGKDQNNGLKKGEDTSIDKDQDYDRVEEPASGYGMSYTYADYLKFEFEEMVELIRGKIFRMSPAPKSFHQEICANLHLFFGNYFRQKACKVYFAPFDVVLPIHHKSKDSSTTVVQPDICVICDLDKIDDAGCFGAPDLVVEILSESTSKKDLNDKYDVYEESGVREYWIVFPKDQIINCYILEDGRFQLNASYTKDDIASPYIFPELDFPLSEVFP